MLGVPSLPSRPFPFEPGLRPASSAVRFGESGPVGLCLCVLWRGGGRRISGVMELADESEVCDCFETSAGFLPAGTRRAEFIGSPFSVALGSLCESEAVVVNGKKAGSSSSSSASSDCPILFAPNRGRRRSRLCMGGSESDEDSWELASDDDKRSRFGD